MADVTMEPVPVVPVDKKYVITITLTEEERESLDIFMNKLEENARINELECDAKYDLGHTVFRQLWWRL